ncbi:IS66 family insertion sequence element accessory protein TnpA [Zooshikella ganghwensis]|uniref:IS66 family insertion sequence element accessory protein TnpB n=1 Tax=Zooshikella ganghwensis TaxID=202772 RepID=A0A4P9VHL6_9GAMM|nr:hypothetical protein [Zooshikella ganghwensis]RDH42209.1 IS66 family insertion sequence hypothetical protein [Zooshikella ganghwensis]RDH42367.1 IS66 family insertion sequence hypothetical protein [Zooshikella ganghwensis]RDH42449.1 IS66 family insertion sequence hypothetical protein [Zooshikella ganghwensis]RDH42665.1 IS66 family insertion sequence hypothetical protein [Zooshikella ganghwensis]RDH42673.1 IS66 family insertion sequence hypothetical protein [Zooshikella ganghwensis]
MKKRTAEEWQSLLDQQAASGLSAAAFCREHKLCPKYFSLRKRQLRHSPSPQQGFIQAHVMASSDDDVLSIRYGKTELRLNPGVSPTWLAALLKQLA